MGDPGKTFDPEEVRTYLRAIRLERGISMVLFLIWGPFFLALRLSLGELAAVLFILGVPLTLIGGVVLVVVQINIRDWLCPRCGNLFKPLQARLWRSCCCEHCGVDLNSLIEKKPAAEDLLA